jgi:hypothetical protein
VRLEIFQSDQNEQHKTGVRAGELSISRYKSSKNGALFYLAQKRRRDHLPVRPLPLHFCAASELGNFGPWRKRARERKEDVTRQEKIGARKKRQRDAKSAEEEFGTCRDDQTSSQPMIAQFALKFSSGPAKKVESTLGIRVVMFIKKKCGVARTYQTGGFCRMAFDIFPYLLQ